MLKLALIINTYMVSRFFDQLQPLYLSTMKSENNLPLTLLLRIVENVEKRDIISFGSISKYYRQILLPITFGTIQVNDTNSKFTLSQLLKESDGDFLKNIGNKSHSLKYLMKNIDCDLPKVLKDLDSLLGLCPNITRISFLGTIFNDYYGKELYYYQNCSTSTMPEYLQGVRHLFCSYHSNDSFSQIKELMFVSKTGFIDDYKYKLRMDESPRFLLCFSNLKVLYLSRFILDYDFLKTLQLLPKFTTLILKNCSVKDQSGYSKAKLGTQKKIPTASISFSFGDAKKHFFEEVFECITSG